MKINLVYLIISQAFALFWCKKDLNENNSPKNKIATNNVSNIGYEVDELELGTDLLNRLYNKYPKTLTNDIDVNFTVEKKFFRQIVMDEKFEAENEDVIEQRIFNNRTTQSPSEVDIIRGMLADFGNYLERSGKRSLKTLAYKVKNLVNPILYMNSILKKTKYSIELNKYFKFIFDKNITCEMDHQLMLFDMLESSIKIFGKASEEMCGLVIDESNITATFDQYDAIEKEIGLSVFEEKASAFEYICQSTYICRRFPSYSDYIAKLLKLIVKLPDRNFLIIANVIEDSIQAKAGFFKSIMDENTVKIVALNLVAIAENSVQITSLMTVIVKTILQRFKVFYSNGVKIRNTTKASRVLIDLIDMTYEVNPENVVAADFQQITKDLTDWGHGKKRDMERIFLYFIYKTIDFFNNCWNSEIKEEVKVLLQIIVTGVAGNETLCQELFTNGSKFATQKHVIYAENEVLNDTVE